VLIFQLFQTVGRLESLTVLEVSFFPHFVDLLLDHCCRVRFFFWLGFLDLHLYFLYHWFKLRLGCWVCRQSSCKSHFDFCFFVCFLVPVKFTSWVRCPWTHFQLLIDCLLQHFSSFHRKYRQVNALSDQKILHALLTFDIRRLNAVFKPKNDRYWFMNDIWRYLERAGQLINAFLITIQWNYNQVSHLPPAVVHICCHFSLDYFGVYKTWMTFTHRFEVITKSSIDQRHVWKANVVNVDLRRLDKSHSCKVFADFFFKASDFTANC
jgi:hypothetical protein